jgi:uncharacterized protein (TIGR02246 family)
MRSAVTCLLVTLLVSVGAAQQRSASTEPAPCESELKEQFIQWAAAYKARNLSGTMSIFADDVIFSFQGSPDQGRAELEAGYRRSFSHTDSSQEWVPHFEEFACAGDLGFVRSTWELVAADKQGASQQLARNRGVDIFRRGSDGRWRIIRSLNYPAAR